MDLRPRCWLAPAHGKRAPQPAASCNSATLSNAASRPQACCPLPAARSLHIEECNSTILRDSIPKPVFSYLMPIVMCCPIVLDTRPTNHQSAHCYHERDAGQR